MKVLYFCVGFVIVSASWSNNIGRRGQDDEDALKIIKKPNLVRRTPLASGTPSDSESEDADRKSSGSDYDRKTSDSDAVQHIASADSSSSESDDDVDYDNDVEPTDDASYIENVDAIITSVKKSVKIINKLISDVENTGLEFGKTLLAWENEVNKARIDNVPQRKEDEYIKTLNAAYESTVDTVMKEYGKENPFDLPMMLENLEVAYSMIPHIKEYNQAKYIKTIDGLWEAVQVLPGEYEMVKSEVGQYIFEKYKDAKTSLQN